MIQLIRGNSFTEVIGAPKWFLQYATRHLSVPVPIGQPKGARFGKIWWHNGEPWGSLVQGERVAAGLTSHMEHLLRHYGLKSETRDVRQKPEEQIPWWSVNATWRPYQNDIHEKLGLHPAGIVNAVPRSGKTLMAARAIDALALPTLYIAPAVAIVRQTYNVFVEHFGEDNVAMLSGSAKPHQRDISKPIVIATTASAVKQSQEWFNTREVLIIDESHHSAAESYHRINVLADHIYYRYLFTGTHFRSGADQLAMEAICSQVIHRITVADLVPKYLARPRVFFMQTQGKVTGQDWREAYDRGIVDHEPRNALVVRCANMLAQDNGVPTIVLTRRRAHADELGDRIPDSVVVKGGASELTSDAIKESCGPSSSAGRNISPGGRRGCTSCSRAHLRFRRS